MSHSAHGADDDFTGHGRASSDRWQPSRLTRRMRRRPTSTCCFPMRNIFDVQSVPTRSPPSRACRCTDREIGLSENAEGESVAAVVVAQSGGERSDKFADIDRGTEGDRRDRGRGRRSKAPPAERRANIPMSNGSEGTDVEALPPAHVDSTHALNRVSTGGKELHNRNIDNDSRRHSSALTSS